MTTLTVLKFDTADGADLMLDRLLQLEKQQLITLQDAAMVTWPAGKKKPKTRQLNQLAVIGGLTGAFWGMLFGVLFFIPFLGMAIGAGMGAMFGAMKDLGIDDKFIKEVQYNVTEGTSALFLLTSEAMLKKVADSVKDMQFEIISTNLSPEEENKLRTLFQEEETAST